jgi:hypothetical protein
MGYIRGEWDQSLERINDIDKESADSEIKLAYPAA